MTLMILKTLMTLLAEVVLPFMDGGAAAIYGVGGADMVAAEATGAVGAPNGVPVGELYVLHRAATLAFAA